MAAKRRHFLWKYFLLPKWMHVSGTHLFLCCSSKDKLQHFNKHTALVFPVIICWTYDYDEWIQFCLNQGWRQYCVCSPPWNSGTSHQCRDRDWRQWYPSLHSSGHAPAQNQLASRRWPTTGNKWPFPPGADWPVEHCRSGIPASSASS